MEMEGDNNQSLSLLAELTNFFFKREGVLDSSRFVDFWATMRGSSYVSTLVMKSIIAITGEEKHASLADVVKRLSNGSLSSLPEIRRTDIDSEVFQLVQNIVATMYFVTLFYKMDPTFGPLKASLTRLSIFGNRMTQVTNSNEYLFLHEIENNILKKSNPSYYVKLFCSMVVPENLDYNNTPARILVLPLILHFIKQNLAHKELSVDIFQTLIDLLEDPSITDDMTQSVLHMLKSFLIYCPYPPTTILPKLIKVVRPYFNWPLVFSNCAFNIIKLASIEIKAPGAGLRSKLIEEIPLLLPANEYNEMVCSGFERKVALVFDSNYKKSKHLYELLQTYKPPQPAGSELQLRMVSSIFESCLCIKSELLGLEFCDAENIDMFYNEAMRILEHSVTLPDAEAIQYRIQNFTELKETISSSLSTIRHFNKPKLLSLAPMDITMKMGAFGPDKITGEKVTHARHHYPKRQSFDTLLEILEGYLKTDTISKPLVKIGVVGGDNTMHSLVSGIVCLRVTHPEIFDKLDVRFYYIPAESSVLSSWIAKQDAWYAKQVMILSQSIQGIYPTTTSLSTPQSNDETPTMFKVPNSKRGIQSLYKLVNPTQTDNLDDESENDDEELFNPAVLLRSELESYFRDAKWPMNIAIYRCECFTDDSTITIPFFMRAQIGMKTIVESFKKQNNLPSQLTEAEVVSSRNFKFNAPVLSLKYIQMTPSNIARITGNQTDKMYHSVTVASLPQPEDKENRINPSPTKPWLELLVQEDQSSKNKKKSTREEPKSFHISQIEISGEEKFEILLDNVLYGPFKKIKITSAMQPDKDKIISLPIMTFYQTDSI